jgi:aldose 1-epimerase
MRRSLSKRWLLPFAAVLFTAAAGVIGGLVATTASATSCTPTITSEPFGTASDKGGAAVLRYTLTNCDRMSVKILTYGGILQQVDVPGKGNKAANVTLGFPTLDDYVDKNSAPLAGPVLRCDHRPLRQPDRERAVPAQRTDLPARDRQPAELAARRHPRLRQQGVDADP